MTQFLSSGVTTTATARSTKAHSGTRERRPAGDLAIGQNRSYTDYGQHILRKVEQQTRNVLPFVVVCALLWNEEWAECLLTSPSPPRGEKAGMRGALVSMC